MRIQIVKQKAKIKKWDTTSELKKLKKFRGQQTGVPESKIKKMDRSYSSNNSEPLSSYYMPVTVLSTILSLQLYVWISHYLHVLLSMVELGYKQVKS